MSLFTAHTSTQYCPQCNSELTFKKIHGAPRLCCTNYPQCHFNAHNKGIKQLKILDQSCPCCGEFLSLNHGEYGIFIGCSNYSLCHFTATKEQIKPKDNQQPLPCPWCVGTVVARSGNGRIFYGCSNYPLCHFSSAQPPLNKSCPHCSFAYAIPFARKFKCLNQQCQQLFSLSADIIKVINAFYNQEVFAYPCESVFGLGCDPRSEQALIQLIKLKQRSEDKGLIIIASNLKYLKPFIELKALNKEHKKQLQQSYPHPRTWIVPAKKGISRLLIGKNSGIAVRISNNLTVSMLCKQVNSALVSTSANRSGEEPAYTTDQIAKMFGTDFPVIGESTDGLSQPSEIVDLLTGEVIRAINPHPSS